MFAKYGRIGLAVEFNLSRTCFIKSGVKASATELLENCVVTLAKKAGLNCGLENDVFGIKELILSAIFESRLAELLVDKLFSAEIRELKFKLAADPKNMVKIMKLSIVVVV